MCTSVAVYDEAGIAGVPTSPLSPQGQSRHDDNHTPAGYVGLSGVDFNRIVAY